MGLFAFGVSGLNLNGRLYDYVYIRNTSWHLYIYCMHVAMYTYIVVSTDVTVANIVTMTVSLPPDQETGDNDSEGEAGSGGGPLGGCIPTTASPSPLPTVPRVQVAERTGDGVAIQSSCLTVLLMLLSAVLIWAV